MKFLTAILNLFRRETAPPPASTAKVPVRVSRRVRASSFADLADVAAFKKWYAIYRERGDSHDVATQRAFAKGDNGIGFTGLNCADDSVCMCALPPDDWRPKFGTKARAAGSRVIVTYHGKDYSGILGDTMPAVENIKNGCGIDLNPGFAKAMGLRPPFVVEVTWRWAD